MMTPDEAVAIAATIFDPKHLRPNGSGDTLISSIETGITMRCLGFEKGRGWLVVDPMTGEQTVLAGTPVDPFVARKILAVARGFGIPVRPGETEQEARDAIEAWLNRERKP